MATNDRRKKSQGKKPREKVSKSQTYGAVQRVFLQILREHETATVDMVHERLEIPASAIMSIGSAISGLAKEGLIERVEFQRTERSKAHGRHVSVWRLTDAGLSRTSRNPRRVLTAFR